MKKLLRVLGIGLAAFFGFAFLAILFTFPRLIAEMEGTLPQNVAIGLAMLAVYAVLCWLGYRLYQRGKAEAAPKPKPAPEPAPTPAPEQKPAPKPVPEEGTVLYYDKDANRSPRDALERLSLGFDQGVPRVSISVGWNEGTHGGGATLVREIPEALRAELTPEALREQMKGLCVPEGLEAADWDDSRVRGRMEAWCREVRRREALRLPEGLYLASHPFAYELHNIGPDGLDDESGVRLWLRLKDGADAEAALRDLGEWQQAHAEKGKACPCVLLTEDRELLKDTPVELRDGCKARGIRVATVEGTRLTDLVDGTAYILRYREWPGAADDAATYGKWWLEEP